MNKNIRALLALLACVLCPSAFATTTWSAQNYDLYSGDFNGDGKTDFIIHNLQYAAQFTATGSSTNPFTCQSLWAP